MSEILLFSSGMDSLISWYKLGKPRCLHITGHSRYSNIELDTIKKLSDNINGLTPIVISGFEWLRHFEKADADIPLRNMIFATVAAEYAETIYITCQLGEQSIPDRTPEFCSLMMAPLSFLKEKKTEVIPMFAGTTKQDMVKWYVEQRLPIEYLYMTYSCYSGEPGRCGNCGACFRTAICLDFNNILPDKFFINDIWSWSGTYTYVKKIMEGKYEPRRAMQTMEVLKKRGII